MPSQPQSPRSSTRTSALADRARQLQTAGKHLEAITVFEEAWRASSSDAGLQQELAFALYNSGRVQDSLVHFHALAERFPNRSEMFSNLATVLLALGHEQTAFAAIERALVLDSSNVVAMSNLAEILQNLGNWDGARETYAAALSIAPSNPKMRMQYGMCLVGLGEWTHGWRELEARTQVPGVHLSPEPIDSPRWPGNQVPIEGKRLLIAYEQGFGDAIMCARFAMVLADRGASVHMRTPATLAPLLVQTPGLSSCTVVGTPLPDHDVHIPLMSLPDALGITPEDLTGNPYLAPTEPCPSHLTETLERLLPDDGRLTVSLSWSGNPNHTNDRRRSINGALLAPLLEVPGVRFVALQKFPPMQAVLPNDLHDRLIDLGVHCRDFLDSAHVLQHVDLAISVDSATAHLAGALGVPTYLCLPFRPEYRWGVSGESTPWYRSVTLVRQPESHAWSAVIDDLVARLSAQRDNCERGITTAE